LRAEIVKSEDQTQNLLNDGHYKIHVAAVIYLGKKLGMQKRMTLGRIEIR
jgi:hypothetical protein